MDRAPFRVAALTAAALLVIAGADARADSGAAASEPATPGEEQAPPADAPPPATATESTTAEEGSLDEGAMGAQQESVQPQLAPEPPPGDAPDQQEDAASPTGPPPSAMSSPSGSNAQVVAPAPPVQPIGGSASSSPEPPIVAQSGYTPAPLLGAIEPKPVAGVRAPPDSPLASGLERRLPDIERELRTVQAQMYDLERRLDKGAPPPKSRLMRLRSSLERIAPVLLALEVQVGAVGGLSPRVRALLHRVRVRLAGARASAADLISVLRRAGARGPELRLLLRELGRFRKLHAALASNLGAERAPALSDAGGNLAYTQVQPALAAAPRHAATAPPEPRAAARPAAASPDRRGADRGAPDERAPGSSAPGSASANPGGVSAASVALLSTLLIALALPQLLARLALSPGRRYRVAFLAPLERPG